MEKCAIEKNCIMLPVKENETEPSDVSIQTKQ